MASLPSRAERQRFPPFRSWTYIPTTVTRRLKRRFSFATTSAVAATRSLPLAGVRQVESPLLRLVR